MATSLGEPQPGAPAAREHFWNLPNTITILRTGAVPLLLFFPFFVDTRFGSQLMAWIFIVAALTDLVDGWLARHFGWKSRFGAAMDPVADKLLVGAVFLGARGNELAWRGKKWESVDHFIRFQKQWSTWAIRISIAFLVLALVYAVSVSGA